MRAKALSSKLSDCFEGSPRPSAFGFNKIPRGESIELTMGGTSTEWTNRNIGGGHRVLSLCTLTQDQFAWLGYRELWVASGRSYDFSEAAITIHIGKKDIIDKDQLMRLEWVAPNASSFQSDVGHPHWQIDVLDTLKNRAPEEAIKFEPDKPKTPVPFSVDTEPNQELNYLENLKLHRMHLASAAAWWRSDPETVSFAPQRESEIDMWLRQSISYVRKELRRCSSKR